MASRGTHHQLDISVQWLENRDSSSQWLENGGERWNQGQHTSQKPVSKKLSAGKWTQESVLSEGSALQAHLEPALLSTGFINYNGRLLVCRVWPHLGDVDSEVVLVEVRGI